MSQGALRQASTVHFRKRVQAEPPVGSGKHLEDTQSRTHLVFVVGGGLQDRRGVGQKVVVFS